MKAYVRYIAINTLRPEILADHYKTHFGLREAARAPSGDIALTDGWVKLCLLASWPDDEIVGLRRFGFAVDDLGALKRRVAEFGATSELQANEGGGFHGEYQALDICGMPWEVSVSNFGLGSAAEAPTGVPRIRHVETSVAGPDRHMAWLQAVFGLEEIATSRTLRARPDAFPLRQLGDGELNLTFLPFDRAPRARMSRAHVERRCVPQHFGWVLPDLDRTLAALPEALHTGWTPVGNMSQAQVSDPDGNVMDLSETWGFEVGFDLWQRGSGPGGPPAELRMPS